MALIKMVEKRSPMSQCEQVNMVKEGGGKQSGGVLFPVIAWITRRGGEGECDHSGGQEGGEDQRESSTGQGGHKKEGGRESL